MAEAKQTVIYVGLNDSTTHVQRFETSKYLTVLKNVCKNYHVAFAVNRIDGGYVHEDGTYVEENTLVLTLLNVPDETIELIATDLCIFFHQESVMVVTSTTSMFFVSDRIDASDLHYGADE